jgi:hypothetical protein
MVPQKHKLAASVIRYTIQVYIPVPRLRISGRPVSAEEQSRSSSKPMVGAVQIATFLTAAITR